MEGQKVKLLNALPLSALTSKSAVLEVREITPEEVRTLLANATFESYIGHAATSRVISQLIGREVPVNRGEARLEAGDVVIVVTLTRRVQGDVEVSLNDLRFFLVKVK